MKDEIILEVFKSKHLQAYEKEYWRLSGYERITREDHQNYLFDKENYLATDQALATKDGKFLCKKNDSKNRQSTIHLGGGSLKSSAEDWIEMDLMFRGKES